MKRDLPIAPADPVTGEPPRADDAALAPPASDAERAEAERLRVALDEAEADAPAARAPELGAEVEAQLRAAVMLHAVRATNRALEPAGERLLETLAKARARLEPAEDRARERRPLRQRRAVVWVALGVALAAGLVLPIALRPQAPAPRDTRGYATLFPAPFTRESRPAERLERMITWRREKR